MHAFQLVKDLGLEVQIKMNYYMDGDYIVIEIGLENLMIDNNVRKKWKETKKLSRKMIIEGRSSHSSLGHFIEDMMVNIPCKKQSEI